MGFFKGLLQTGKSLGRNIGGAFGDAANRTGTGAKIALQISALEMEQGKLEREYDNLCTAVGKKYIEYLMAMDKEPEINIDAEIRRILPNVKRREEIEDEIAELKANAEVDIQLTKCKISSRKNSTTPNRNISRRKENWIRHCAAA